MPFAPSRPNADEGCVVGPPDETPPMLRIQPGPYKDLPKITYINKGLALGPTENEDLYQCKRTNSVEHLHALAPDKHAKPHLL
jgi:hypothetical protein